MQSESIAIHEVEVPKTTGTILIAFTFHELVIMKGECNQNL